MKDLSEINRCNLMIAKLIGNIVYEKAFPGYDPMGTFKVLSTWVYFDNKTLLTEEDIRNYCIDNIKTEQLEFHSSWDSLMYVIIKLPELYRKAKIDNTDYINIELDEDDEGQYWCIETVKNRFTTKRNHNPINPILDLWDCLVQHIEYINQYTITK